MREAKGVPGLAMDVEPTGAAAMGVVQARQRCFLVERMPGAPSRTTEFTDFEMVITSIENERLSDRTLPDGACIWLDLQGTGMEQNRRVLQLLFPEMQSSQMEAVLDADAEDVVELQPVKGQYLIGSLACARGRGRGLSSTSTADGDAEGDAISCSFACSERCLVTVHTAPFVGLAELLRHVEVEGNRRRQTHEFPFTDEMSMDAGSPSTLVPQNMTSATILCTLVCFTCEAFLPDPTSLLSEVGNIDEMVLLISPGQQDQADLLRRVALLRRRISNFRTALFLKEKLLRELIAPTMRSSFVGKGPAVVRTYKEALEKVMQVSERLDDTRDMLNQANLNFVTGVSMRMSQASAGLDFKMTVLNQVAAVCLPINLVISIFGMNCKVPYITDQNDTLVPFYCICGVLLAWAILCLTPLFREAIRGTSSSAIAPYE
ncbi:MGT2 magnesium transporter [Trypanosoma theileri]|uniref:MGT2 magnesium transporter n=1 Tax=Trypanosoma theileri TaxID=67003 RepID=A0A1X0NLW5_9TRYP|nr:MGT2 magnesium transporter [Trypanosoma theileri]ORC85724.1 MGT2 magnesium transporter [Trypanosoma theileri]